MSNIRSLFYNSNIYTNILIRQQRSLLEKCASTALSSKLVAQHKEFFGKMVVDAVMMLGELMPLNMIGMKKVNGGALEVRNSIQSCFIHSEF